MADSPRNLDTTSAPLDLGNQMERNDSGRIILAQVARLSQRTSMILLALATVGASPGAQETVKSASFPADAELGRFLAPRAVGSFPSGRADGARAVKAAVESFRTATMREARRELSIDSTFGYAIGWVQIRNQRDSLQWASYTSVWKNDDKSGWSRVAVVIAPTRSQPGALPEACTKYGTKPKGASSHAAGTFDAIEADRQFSAMSKAEGAGKAFETYAAPWAAMLGGEQPSCGPESIGAGFANPPQGASLTWGPLTADGSNSGDLAFTMGEALSSAPGRPDRHMRYVTIWSRLPNGQMRYVADMGNVLPAARP